MRRPSVLERADELASSGLYVTIEAIIRTLHHEGYEGSHSHLGGSVMRKRLRLRMKEAAVRVEPRPESI